MTTDTPKGSGEQRIAADFAFTFRLSDDAREEMRRIKRREARVFQTSHRYIFK